MPDKGCQMEFLGQARAWRGALLAFAMICFGPAMASAADATNVVDDLDGASLSAEPFGLAASPVSGGGLQAKWLGVAHKIDDERVQLALCDGDHARCASDAALKLLGIVDEARARDGRGRLGEINRAINLAIHPMSDLAQYGEIDVWSSPLVTLDHGAGDCEDYAIAKFVALQLAGIAAEDLRIVVMRDLLQGKDHAVAAARLDGRWLMLDNRRMAMIDDAHVRNYRPLFVIDQSTVMKYSDTPLSADLRDHDSAPASTLGKSSSSCQSWVVGCRWRPKGDGIDRFQAAEMQ
jgi:predicted transglutaminase-like cysteine proteinase